MKPYYEGNGVALYHGDSREVLPTLGPVDLVLTDPPYGERTVKGARKRVIYQQKERNEAFIDYDGLSLGELRGIIGQAARLARRWIVASMEWTHAASLETDPLPGTRFIRCGVWVKSNGSPQFSGDRPAMGWEAIAILHRDGVPLRWNGKGSKAVWTTPVQRNNGHPTPKPLALWKPLLRLFSDPGEVVLDPFAGSGTTLIAAHHLGRQAIGIELEERWCELIARRVSGSARADPRAPEVLRRYEAGERQAAIAASLGVSQATVCRIIRHRAGTAEALRPRSRTNRKGCDSGADNRHSVNEGGAE